MAAGIVGSALWLASGFFLAGAESEVASRLGMVGIGIPNDARSFLDRLKAAAKNKDHGALASLVRYPLAMHDNGKVIKIYRTRTALLATFDAVFTPRVLQAIEAAKFETLFVRDQGAMIGDGEIWFDGRNGRVLVKAINP
jgi:hypothetical protein